MLIIGKDHLTAAGQEWNTVKGCFKYTAYIFKSRHGSKASYLDAMVGPIGVSSDELYIFERVWSSGNNHLKEEKTS